jgi:hypothetical protein
MPFNSPFKNTYTSGDLVYGFSPSRRRLIMKFVNEISTGDGRAVTVDMFKKSVAIAEGAPTVAKASWQQFLAKNKKHPQYKDYYSKIAKYGFDDESFANDPQATDVELNAAWRAKSKFGLDWALRNKVGHIHFVLDDIDMAAVVTKTHKFTDAAGKVLAEDDPRGKAPGGIDKERTITHSELRWVYRNRKNPLVSQGVQFWLSNTAGTILPCGAPWDDAVRETTMPSSKGGTETGAVKKWKDAWSAYKPTKERSEFEPQL